MNQIIQPQRWVYRPENDNQCFLRVGHILLLWRRRYPERTRFPQLVIEAGAAELPETLPRLRADTK